MSHYRYKVARCVWAPLGTAVPVALSSTGGSFSQLSSHIEIRQGSIDIENDASMVFTLWFVGRATATAARYRIRVYDQTAAQVVIGPTAYLVVGTAFQVLTSRGPITPALPSGDARWELQYEGGGSGATWYAAGLDISRVAG